MSPVKKILYIQYTNPTAYPPLENSSRIFGDAGWMVSFLGIQSRGTSNLLRFCSHPAISVELMPYCAPGWRQKLHYLRFALWCIYKYLIERPQVVYASDIWSYPIAVFLTYLPGPIVVMHEHDTPALVGSRVLRLVSWFRLQLIKRAHACICPQANRAAALAEQKPKNLFVVHNCPLTKDWAQKERTNFDVLRLWYHGSIGAPLLPLQVLHAIRQCEFPIHLTFAGYETIGSEGYVDKFMKESQTLGLQSRVTFLGPIPHKQLLAKAAENHIGLVLFDMKLLEPMVGASNKPFDYLAAGLAMLVPNTPEWEQFFVAKGCAVSCEPNNVDSITDALGRFRIDPSLITHCAQKGTQLLTSEWNYEYQFRPVFDFVARSALLA